MDWVQPLTNALSTQMGQFFLGVMILVFGSSAILSEKTAKEKFWLIGRVAGWFQRRKEEQAELEAQITERRFAALQDEIARIDKNQKRSDKVMHRQHEYIVWITTRWRALEVWAADRGLRLPDPPFQTFEEWKAQIPTEEDEEDE